MRSPQVLAVPWGKSRCETGAVSLGAVNTDERYIADRITRGIEGKTLRKPDSHQKFPPRRIWSESEAQRYDHHPDNYDWISEISVQVTQTWGSRKTVEVTDKRQAGFLSDVLADAVIARLVQS